MSPAAALSDSRAALTQVIKAMAGPEAEPRADQITAVAELVDNRRRVGSVVGEPAQRVRRRKNGVTVADEPVKHRPPARSVSECAVNENDCRISHTEFLSFRGAGSQTKIRA